MKKKIKKGFVNAGTGQVHYRISGSGTPIILLHDSPRSSVLHLPLLEYFSNNFSVIAIDTPGYGNSTPLESSGQLEISNFSEALNEAISGLKIGSCAIYGFHTSSKILLDFCSKYPEKISIAIMDGLSLPAGDIDHEFISKYMKPFKINSTGSYLAEEWTRIRDFQRWFPWFSKTKETRLISPQKDLSFLHNYCMDLFMANKHFSDAYAAAMRYKAIEIVPSATANCIFMAREDDVLYPFLDTLENIIHSNSKIERLSPDREKWKKRLKEIFENSEILNKEKNFNPPDPLTQKARLNTITKGYVSTSEGQVLIRKSGTGKLLPIILLHDLPGSSRNYEDLIKKLSDNREVYGIDLPGCNDSDELHEANIESYLNSILEIITNLNLDKINLIADGMSTPLAIAFAAKYKKIVHKLVLDKIVLSETRQRQEMKVNYLPDLSPSIEGSHLHRCWHMLRDQHFQWPWYDGSSKSIRKITTEIKPEILHIRLVDTLKNWKNAKDPILASLDVNTRDCISQINSPTLVLNDENDVRYKWTNDYLELTKSGFKQNRPDNISAMAETILDFIN